MMTKNQTGFNCLFICDTQQFYTPAVWQHANDFQKHSVHNYHYLDYRELSKPIDLNIYHIVLIHYSVRLCFNSLSSFAAIQIKDFNGLKIVFIQDEYNVTDTAIFWISEMRIDAVFSTVKTDEIENIYPRTLFNNYPKFFEADYGYVPDTFPISDIELKPHKDRAIEVGYRGRNLPMFYGYLGFQKAILPHFLNLKLKKLSIKTDIEPHDKGRLYGRKWFEFISRCNTFFVSDSGSNIFDFSGSLAEDVETKSSFPIKMQSFEILKKKKISPIEKPGLMNKISPKFFELAVCKTALILPSDTLIKELKPYKHFFPLSPNLSNIVELRDFLSNKEKISKMAQRTYDHLIRSKTFSAVSFIKYFDEMISKHEKMLNLRNTEAPITTNKPILGSFKKDPAIVTILRPLYYFLRPILIFIFPRRLLSRYKRSFKKVIAHIYS